MGKTHCKFGHALSGENLYLSPKGARGCRKCRCAHAISSHKRNPDLQRLRSREWMQRERIKNPERLKEYNLRNDYGIGLAEYNEKLERQQHHCEICKRIMSSPHVDHDHDTNQVRDLLCRECNSALGFLREDTGVAESLVAYLKKWKS